MKVAAIGSIAFKRDNWPVLHVDFLVFDRDLERFRDLTTEEIIARYFEPQLHFLVNAVKERLA